MNRHTLFKRSLKFPQMAVSSHHHPVDMMTGEDDITHASGAVYPRLTSPGSQIRLLRGSGQGASLTYESHVFDRDDAPACEAISYTWGELDFSNIDINGVRTEVRANCSNALETRHYCRNATLWTWIDSICIDQENAVEKSLQVRIMGSIFNKAERVIAILRPLDNIDSYIPCLLSHVSHAAAVMAQKSHMSETRTDDTNKWMQYSEALSWCQSISDWREHSLFDLIEALGELGAHSY